MELKVICAAALRYYLGEGLYYLDPSVQMELKTTFQKVKHLNFLTFRGE